MPYGTRNYAAGTTLLLLTGKRGAPRFLPLTEVIHRTSYSPSSPVATRPPTATFFSASFMHSNVAPVSSRPRTHSTGQSTCRDQLQRAQDVLGRFPVSITVCRSVAQLLGALRALVTVLYGGAWFMCPLVARNKSLPDPPGASLWRPFCAKLASAEVWRARGAGCVVGLMSISSLRPVSILAELFVLLVSPIQG
jgi:hypothetical protein